MFVNKEKALSLLRELEELLARYEIAAERSAELLYELEKLEIRTSISELAKAVGDWEKFSDFVGLTFNASDDEHDYLIEASVGVKSIIAKVEAETAEMEDERK